MPETLQRRAVTLVSVTGLLVVFNTLNATSFVTGPSTWQVVVHILSFAAFIGCLALCLLALAPNGRWVTERESLVFWAAVAFAAGLLLIAGSSSASAVQLLHNNGFSDFSPDG